MKEGGKRGRERARERESEGLLLDFKMTGIGLHVIKKENQRECEMLQSVTVGLLPGPVYDAGGMLHLLICLPELHPCNL